MPTTLLDGETWEQAYARRFREEHWEAVMQDEINRAVDETADAICMAFRVINDLQRQIVHVRGLEEATDRANGEFKYARMAGQLSGFLDSVEISTSLLDARMKDAEAAIRYIKGESDE